MTNYLQHSNAEYVMPFLFVHDLFIPVLSELLKNEKNSIKYVYGTVKSAWSGGRLSSSYLDRLDIIKKVLDKIVNRYNYIPTFTFTSTSITKEKLNDEFCNNLLDIAYSKNCHFITASEDLYNHITKRYSDAHMVSSVITPSLKIHTPFFDETKFYNEMLDKYEIVVLRPEYTIENIDNIDKLIDDVSRVEVLINQTCAWNCNVSKNHYNLIEKVETNDITFEEFDRQFTGLCPKFHSNYKSVCMNNEIVSKLLDKGITKLKIQGRGRDFYETDTLFQELYKFFFNNDIPFEQIENEFNKIIVKMVKANKLVSLQLL